MFRKSIHLIYLVVILGVAFTSPVQAALVAWWKLDEGSGTMASDSSGNGNNATFQGTSAWVENGKFGKSGKV